jgi:hypothetical protein
MIIIIHDFPRLRIDHNCSAVVVRWRRLLVLVLLLLVRIVWWLRWIVLVVFLLLLLLRRRMCRRWKRRITYRRGGRGRAVVSGPLWLRSGHYSGRAMIHWR